MRRSKRTSIRTETKEIWIIRRNEATGIVVWCEDCEAEVQCLSLAETAGFKGLRQSEIFRLVKAGDVHIRETADGLLLICLNSLLSAKDEKAKINR
jgi:hypothetical protein